jgi:hypothetical protein
VVRSLVATLESSNVIVHIVSSGTCRGHRRHDQLRDQPRRLSVCPNHHCHGSFEVRADGDPRSRIAACLRGRGVGCRRRRERQGVVSRRKGTAPATISRPGRRSTPSGWCEMSSMPRVRRGCYRPSQ